MKQINAYLIFDGNCREAMEFYAKCLGADLHLVPFSEAPGTPKDAADRIIHARLSKGNAVLMASDTMPDIPVTQGNNLHISIDCESNEEIDRFFAALSHGGKVKMPLQNTFWNAKFGMLTDKFGNNWMLNHELTKK